MVSLSGNEISLGMAILLAVMVVWEAVWKGIAMWNSARNKHTAWIVLILILNTVGILPIIYMAIHVWGKKKKR